MFNVTHVPQSDLARSIADQAKSGDTIKTIAVGRSDIFRVNPFSIHIKDGWNCRDMDSVENQEHIDATARSIAEYGVREPLTVYSQDGMLWVSDGHVRLTATFRAIEVYGAEILTIPVKTEPKGSTEEDRLLSQVIRNSGKPFSALEQAKLAKRFSDMGWTIDQIAKKWTVSIAKINSLLDLNAAPVEIKQMINNGTVSTTLAQSVIRESGELGAVKILGDAVESAHKEGKSRVTAKDTGAVPLKKLVKAALECSEIDYEECPVIIKMPLSEWEKIREALKL